MKLALFFSAALSGALAQNFSGQPACATSCLSSAITAAGCALDDAACQCGPTQAAIATNAVGCLVAACTAAGDLAQAQSAGQAACSAYSATASATSSTSSSSGSTTTTSGSVVITVTSGNSTITTTARGSTTGSASATGCSTCGITSRPATTATTSRVAPTTKPPNANDGSQQAGFDVAIMVALLGAVAAL
ncbi:hypothetical protein B0T16DRAFT_384410 [Cercophora newfieldiana]|uniref:CFEM domain-containing protein n=1 Tax=Cercophora newfieldiana TaxID=92897 RepID=A0AA40D091_9PEZI|nr:hypothetical protein B0T16DRAFT_384410 [Cercophora newfieldiana]